MEFPAVLLTARIWLMTIEKMKHISEKRLANICGLSRPSFSISGSVNVPVCSSSVRTWGGPDVADAGGVAIDMVHQEAVDSGE